MHRHQGVMVLAALLQGCGGAVSDSSEQDGPGDPPGTPVNVSSRAGDGRAVIQWSPVDGADRYTLYMANDYPVTPDNYTALTNPMRHQNIQDTEFVHPGLTNGMTYYFTVTAANALGESAASAIVAASPKATTDHAPVEPKATVGDGRVILDWTPPGPGHFIYNVYWSPSDGASQSTGVKLADVGDRPFVHNDRDPSTAGIQSLTNGQTYYYVITAVDGTNTESEDSAQVAAVPGGTRQPPPKPTAYNVVPGDGRLTIQWGRVPGADRYILYMAAQSGVAADNYSTLPSGMEHKGITALSFDHPGLSNGTTYYFILYAANDAGRSQASEEFSAAPAAP